MRTIIHVNRHRILRNRLRGEDQPVITVKTYKSNLYAHEVEVRGPCRIVYAPCSPLKCGAVAYVVTESEVVVIK